MAGVAGRSGTNKNKDKPFRDALRMEAIALENGEIITHPAGSLRAIAQATLMKASMGDTPATNLVGDRLDGKPAQAIIGGDEDEPAIQVNTRDAARAVAEVFREALTKQKDKE
jgi:hypothetical protein